MTDWKRVNVAIGQCPAVQCSAAEAHDVLQEITKERFMEEHSRLEALNHGRSYEYDRCVAYCHRIWRFRRVGLRDAYYVPPECIGKWDPGRESPTIFEPHKSDILGPADLKWQYCGSKKYPGRPAQSKADAQR